MELGLYARRKAAGIRNQSTVADKANIPLDLYRRYERGEAIPPEDRLERILKAIEQIVEENAAKAATA